jgi:tetratricopeptide (TPR) repeat protein
MAKGPRRLDLSRYLRRKPLDLALLTGLAVVAFVFVEGLSRIYFAQQRSLAERWSARGTADLKAQNYPAAVADFRSSLLYARDNGIYQLDLAEALLGMKRTDEAYNYLINLWEREPENGMVNLELARIAAQREDTHQALRFYHDAIYATWPGNQEEETQNCRLELIHYLLRSHALAQAQAELMALEANIPDDSPEQVQLGQLFLQAQGYQQALHAFQLGLRSNRRNHEAMLGAGMAAFQLGLYPAAERYLRDAVITSPHDAQSMTWFKKARFVLETDPYLPDLSEVQKNRIALNAFATAGNRLKVCPAQGSPAVPAAVLQGLEQQWTKLKPQMTEWRLRRNPDLVNTAMDLAFQIERQTVIGCAAPTQADQALLLIANLHEEN